MSKKRQGKKAAVREDDGYPFDTGDWEKWTNRKRLDWLVNMRDKLRDTYKQKFNISDEKIAQLSADVEEMEKIVFAEEYNAAYQTARNAASPRESARLLGLLIDDICANGYYKARRIGLTDAQIDKMREDTDKYLAEIDEWERRRNANMILGIPVKPPPSDKAVPPGNTPGDVLPDDDIPASTALRVLQAWSDIDDTALKAAFASGDEEAANREFEALIEKLEAKAAADPVFAKWFEDFRTDQEKLLCWDETIGEDED
jgi:hypothetical protein